LTKLSSKLTKDELSILEKKYISKRINALAEAEINTLSGEALKRIHVITGWALPNSLEYVKILFSEFAIFLKEFYSELNFDEVHHAFRQSVGKQDWGKNMNLELISSVLNAYLAERLRISHEEEKNALIEPQKLYSDIELDNIQRWDIESFYQRCLKGNIPTHIPSYFLPILIKDGFMLEGSDDMASFFSEKLNAGKKNLYLMTT
jgi:hypothetical protein